MHRPMVRTMLQYYFLYGQANYSGPHLFTSKFENTHNNLFQTTITNISYFIMSGSPVSETFLSCCSAYRTQPNCSKPSHFQNIIDLPRLHYSKLLFSLDPISMASPSCPSRAQRAHRLEAYSMRSITSAYWPTVAGNALARSSVESEPHHDRYQCRRRRNW